jgi:hypothetical protein
MKKRGKQSSLKEFIKGFFALHLRTSGVITFGAFIMLMSTKLNPASVTCASLTAIFGILADFYMARSKSELLSKKLLKKKGKQKSFINQIRTKPQLIRNDFSRRYKIYKAVGVFFNILFFIFILITVLAGIKPQLFNELLENSTLKEVTDVLAIMGLGISLLLIGVKNQIAFKEKA